MKYSLAGLFLLTALLLFNPVVAQTKHAVIFAVGNYPTTGGWSTISSVNDVNYIKTTLLRQGFKPGDIKTVLDAGVTVKGIADALNGLNNRVKAGHVVVIHFSSHGQQVEDEEQGDETDFLDESVVTYNAKAPVGDGRSEDFKKDQEGYLRDDLLGSLVKQIRAKLGKNGDVVVFMDLCHSGSGTRGIKKVRGNKPPLVSSTFDTRKYNLKDTSSVITEKADSKEGENALATYVVFSAARAEELNYETTDDDNKDVGSLTYAVSKVFEKLEKGTTYRSLFARIQSVMNEKVPGQHPVLEGNGLDRALFGGSFVNQKPYVEIEKINGKEITVSAGLFAGLDTGAKVAVYNSGTADPAKATALDSGKVIKADMYKSVVRLTKDFGNRQAASAWAFVTEPSYNIKPIQVRIADGFSASEITDIKKALKDLPLFKVGGEPELLLVKGAATDSVKIAANGYVFDTFGNANADVGQLKEKLQNYAQYKFLQGLEVKYSDINVEVKLVPVINGKPDTTHITRRLINGVYEFSEGDKMVLCVKNTGKEPVYSNVLDIQPDGIINPVFPNRRLNIYARDLRIEAGTSRLFDKNQLSVAPPYGTEIFKVFASTDAIDLEIIANSKGQQARSNFNVLERLVRRSYDIASRGVSGENIGGANGSSYNVLFRIKPKQ